MADHLRPIGELMHRLIQELRDDYEQEPTCQILMRVFREHFTLDDEDDLRPRKGKELSAGSLQSPERKMPFVSLVLIVAVTVLFALDEVVSILHPLTRIGGEIYLPGVFSFISSIGFVVVTAVVVLRVVG